MAKSSLTYKDAGVDIDAGNALAKAYLHNMRSTFGPQVLQNDGGFAGLYRLWGTSGLFERRISDPVLVAGADGVGTKLKIAFAMDKHDTIGIDLVAMSVNDILVQGAEPIFFLDYVGAGKVSETTMAAVVAGVGEGCRRAGCALLGGETAELPGFYTEGEYDLAGFAVGVVERSRLITGQTVEAGDELIGLASDGLHSNGYSLARKALLEVGGMALDDEVDELGRPLGTEMLRPTRIYVQPVLKALRHYKVKRPIKALVHITGGGLVENIPRILPPKLDAVIQRGAWPVPPIFDLIAKRGGVARDEMDRVFNMGIGMVLAVAPFAADALMRRLARDGERPFRIGTIRKGSGRVRLIDKSR